MNDKQLHQQKAQAWLDEWKAEVEKLEVKASRANADVQLEMNQQTRVLERIRPSSRSLQRLVKTRGSRSRRALSLLATH